MTTAVRNEGATWTTTGLRGTVWEIDPAHTNVEFAVRHMMIATVRGRFAGVSGRFTAEAVAGEPLASVAIDASTIDTREAKRDAHLRSADFLDVANYPEIRFEGRRLDRATPDHLRLVGDLTIRGVTKEVILNVVAQGEARDPWGNERVGYSASTKISRRDFGLEWNAALETGGVLVGDELKITIDVEGVRQS